MFIIVYKFTKRKPADIKSTQCVWFESVEIRSGGK